jgi:hypothetical protein
MCDGACGCEIDRILGLSNSDGVDIALVSLPVLKFFASDAKVFHDI